MNSIETSRYIEVNNAEDLAEYSIQTGWDALYTQMAPGLFSGSYRERIGETVITTSETLSLPVYTRFGGIPGYIGLGLLLSDTPAKLNGLVLNSSSFFLLMPDSDFCITTTGPVTALVAIFPESELESVFKDTYIAIRKSVPNVQVFGFDLDEEASRFKDWFTTWLTNPFTQSEGFQQHLSHQIYEVVYTTIARIGENIEEAARGHRLKSGRRPIKELLDLADYFYHNTEEQLTTAEMTAISGINRRNLFYNFKHHTGFTPHQLFKYIRLQAVRRDLMNAAGNVTELAMKHNFHHLGEFSRLYKSTYGELPSRTLNKL